MRDTVSQLYPGVRLLQLVVGATLILLWHTSIIVHGAGDVSILARPNCPDKCPNGNVSIPYPFGIGEDCFMHRDFEVKCDERGQANVTVGDHYRSGDTVLLEINILLGEARVQSAWSVEWSCNYTSDDNWEEKFVWVSLGKYFKLSSKNKLMAIGCTTIGTIVGFTSSDEDIMRSNDSRISTSACASFCDREDGISQSAECNGMGCCQASIPQNLTTYRFAFVKSSELTSSIGAPNTLRPYFSRLAETKSFSPCSYAFVIEENWFEFVPSYAKQKNFQIQDGRLPMVIDWSVGTETCDEAKKNKSSYACVAANSECIPARSGQGYLCNCSHGYEGNPYLDAGCKDINECDHPFVYPCFGFCANKIGSYDCSCPQDSQSNDPKSIPCTPIHADTRRQMKVIIGTSISSVFLVICISALLIKCQTRQLAKEKERFFKQNGGHILYQQILSKQIDTVVIFTVEDLKKATNNYDSSRELGAGGHGTVYKGILGDNKVVAVKRSRIMNVIHTEEFIQEIIILSQINHRNVVRLIGCCLEVEVPILVYEFIPNGTLFHLIHGKEPISLEVRLRIAQESAEALAYMHLSINHPIVHGDVKSLNILLDQDYSAKVTDFGASRLLPKDEAQLMTMVQGTLGYLDPEYLQERILTEKSDVYSFGVVLLELITRKIAIFSESAREQKSLASSFLLAMKENRVEGILDTSIMGVEMEDLFEEISKLVSMCLSFKGEERPSMTQVADKLKAIRSTWREVLLLKHKETQRLGMDLVRDLSPSMFYTAQMLGLDIETPSTDQLC